MDIPTTFVGIDESGLQWQVEHFGDMARVSTRRDAQERWSAPVVCLPVPVDDGTFAAEYAEQAGR